MEDLDKKYQSNGFRVPEDYFENLDERVFERLRTEQKPQLKVWKKTQTWLAAASIALLFGIGGYFFFRNSPVPDQQISFDSIDATELLAYENEAELNEEEFEEFIPAYTVDSLYEAEILSAASTGFSQEELTDLEEEFSALEDEETDI